MENIEFKSSSKYPLIFKKEYNGTNTIVSGCFPEHKWEVDQIINSTHPLLKGIFTVKTIIEQHDCKGNFEKESDKTNSFFKLEILQQ
jgi:hypothetical protein